MGELKVAIRLPEDLQSAERLKTRLLERVFCSRRPLIGKLCFSPGRIADTFSGQKGMLNHMHDVRLVYCPASFAAFIGSAIFRNVGPI